jgi:hypothetical protein
MHNNGSYTLQYAEITDIFADMQTFISIGTHIFYSDSTREFLQPKGLIPA